MANLLSRTRLESGVLELRRSRRSIREGTGAALDRANGRHDAVRIQCDVPPELFDALLDPGLVEQALLNLVDNAIRYSPPGGTVRVAARSPGEELVISVEDEGDGLPVQEVEVVFDRNRRTAARDGEPGAGSGLEICRGIVSAHHGRIWAENRPEGGAAFRFTLPLDAAPAAAAGPEAEAGA